MTFFSVERENEQQCPITDYKDVNIRRCHLGSQLPDPVKKTRVYRKTDWILGSRSSNLANSDEHYKSTTMADYVEREPCEKPSAPRKKLMWKFLLKEMSEQVCTRRFLFDPLQH